MMPTNKVMAGAAAGAAATIVTWGVKAAWGIEVPPEVAVAITALLTFMTQYWVPDAA